MDDDAHRLMAAIQALVRRFSVAERADVACCGMTVAQAATLDALSREDGLPLSELRRRLGVAASTMTRNLERLRDRGLVETAIDPSDRRACRVTLTPAGRRSAADIDARELAFANAIAAALGGDGPREVVVALERLLAAVRTASQSCCPGAFDHLVTTTTWTGGTSDVELED